MNTKKHHITDWLDSNSKKEAPIYRLSHRSFETYYYENDKNLITNNDYKIKELLELNKNINGCYNYYELIEDKSVEELEYEDELIQESNYVHVFKKKNNQRFIQYIDPNSRRYHINMLFNCILDYCKTNEINDFKNNLLIGKKMRNEFVKFCHENRN